MSFVEIACAELNENGKYYSYNNDNDNDNDIR